MNLNITDFLDFLESGQWVPFIPEEYSMGNWSMAF
jgi:hypothetical protein